MAHHLASIYGTGTQLFLVTLVVFALCLAGTFFGIAIGKVKV